MTAFVAFAEHQFELDKIVEGSTVREHLEVAQRHSGRVPEMLANAPPLPDGCETLWRDFVHLRENAGGNGFGPNRIAYGEIDAYQRLGGFRFEAWEIDAIRRTDTAFMIHNAASRKEREA